LKTFVVTLGLLGTVLAATSAAQTPTVGGLENNYSFVVPGLPNYGIAQGSIFDIFGSNLANSSTGLQATPVTPLSGVSVAVTVGGATKQALLYYVTPGQIAAVLPSSTPVGTGTLTVTNNGKTSATAPIVVVAAAFGILTLNGAGSGPAAAFDSNGSYLGASNATNPGQTIVLWGTGAGPIANDLQQAAPSPPLLQVYIGGVLASVAYQGRSQFTGLDQINVAIPAGVSGCYVSLVVQAGVYVSNFSSLPIATSGHTCSDPATTPGGLTTTQLQSLAGKTTISVGSVGMFKTTSTTPAVVVQGITVSPASTLDIEDGFAGFTKITLPQNYNSYISSATGTTASIGSCTVFTLVEDTSTIPATPSPFPGSITYLNAGPVININGPVGKKTMPLSTTGGILSYSAQLGGNTGTSTLPTFIPATGGTFTFDNGSGGADVGAFTASLSLTPVVWTNNTITTVNRAAGQSVTWTGGDANTYVSITGESFVSSGTKFLIGEFTCTAPSAAHQFTIPGPVLLSIPASGSISAGGISIPEPGSLTVSSFGNSTSFSAPGIDLGYIYAYSGSGASVTYQ
jgi:uncharacterized protein (TIGR03437 family)